MLLISGYVDDNDRYNEGEAEQIECMAIECHCGWGESEKILLIWNNCDLSSGRARSRRRRFA